MVKEREAAAKKAQKEQQKSMAAKAKKAAKAVLKRKGASSKVKALVKTSSRRFVVILNPIVEVVVPEARKTATRTITRL